MITLLISIAALILGYLVYGSFVARVFAPDAAAITPAYSKQDGVDYVPMPAWKVFMIEFLNIAGTGPIFGAILDAMYGPACYFWIVFGCIFGGAVHDYFSGMLSLRHGGASLPELVGEYLGKGARTVMRVFAVLMLMLVGAVFVYSPALILGGMTGGTTTATLIWVGVVLVYYMIATMVPIDKIIGRIYPVFAIALVFMALSLLVCLIGKWPSGVPEVWDGLQNRAPQLGGIFPGMFISIACGAVSGFHATQSPLMARCIKNEKLGRPVFYGSMILEGVVALIWATVSAYFFYGGGAADMGAEGVTAAPAVVTTVSKHWLGAFGSVLALLGVVAAPITSGDTALRSVRLMVCEAFGLRQKTVGDRLKVCIPIFLLVGALLTFNILDSKGFDVIWRYFGWANQTLSIFTFWTITVFLARRRGGLTFLMTMLPACFMSAVCVSFICTARIGFNLPSAWAPYIGAVTFVLAAALFLLWLKRQRR